MRPSSSPSEGLFDGVLGRGAARAAVSDHAWLRAMLDVEAALARACAEVGLVPAAAAAAIAEACKDPGAYDLAGLGAAAAASASPVVPLVRAIEDRAGPDAAGWVHLGATSQDVLDSALVLVARRAGAPVLADLVGAADAAAALARRHAGTAVVGRTLLQQALPTTFGMKAAGWALALDHAAARLAETVAALPVQLGGAVGTLAGYGPAADGVVAALARELGLPAPVLAWHTARGPVADLAGSLGAAAGAVSKVALDVCLLAQGEVGEVREGTPGRGGSSALPHKHNPVAAVSARAAAQQAPGLVATVLAAMAQEHERAAGGWQSEGQTVSALLQATGSAAAWLRDSLEHLEVDEQRMADNLERAGADLGAEAVAGALSQELGRGAAHELVSSAVQRARTSARPLVEELQGDPACRLSAERLAELLSPATGQAAALVARALAGRRP